MHKLTHAALLLALLFTPAVAQTPTLQLFPFSLMGKAAGASGQLSVRAVSSSQSLSMLSLHGLVPNTGYTAHYHALGPKGNDPCTSNGPMTLSFPAFKADARGQATVTLRADPARLQGALGAYVDVHLAADSAGALLCATVLKVIPPAEALPSSSPTAPIIRIGDNTFMPASLTIPAGTTVTWVHTGQVTHNVLSLQVAELSSPDLHPGEKYSYTFKTPGTYTYYCSYHDGMSATITVTNR